MNPTRLELKCPSGWFAAGREMRLAATLLSDSAFKLFVWTCLHAERNSGRLRLVVADLARSLQKTECEINLCIQELVRAGVCRLHASGSIQIQERFWPYQRKLSEPTPMTLRHMSPPSGGSFSARAVSPAPFPQPTSDWPRSGTVAVFPWSEPSVRFTWVLPANTSPCSITERDPRSRPCLTLKT
jgi:hypothetical protein